MHASLVSILVPLFDEEEFIGPLLMKVLAAPLPEGLLREIIVVDDGSSDGSAEIVAQMAEASSGVIQLVRHARNQGKGAARPYRCPACARRVDDHPGRRPRV